jgi:hypothetical protein
MAKNFFFGAISQPFFVLEQNLNNDSPKNGKNKRGLWSVLLLRNWLLTLIFGVVNLGSVFCRVVAIKGLKINFRVKVHFRDPYYFSHFWGVILMKFVLKQKNGWVLSQFFFFCHNSQEGAALIYPKLYTYFMDLYQSKNANISGGFFFLILCSTQETSVKESR